MFNTRLGLYRNPFDDTDRLYDQMRAFFTAFDEPSRRRGVLTGPPANVYDRGESFVVELLVPGLKEEDFSVHLTGETLTVRGESKVEAPEGYAAHRRERRPLRFARSFSFPTRLNAEQTTARLANGVLTIELPRSPEVQPRTIKVSVG